MPPRLRERLPAVARAAVRAYRLPEALRREPAFRAPRTLRETHPRVTEIFDAGGRCARRSGRIPVLIPGRTPGGRRWPAPRPAAWTSF
ncbi:hypothetical protein GCM10008965_02780 [Methylorubrum aminovorans]